MTNLTSVPGADVVPAAPAKSAGRKPGLKREVNALTGMAHHLERTALRVLTDCAPEFVPVAVPYAVALIDPGPSATLRLTGSG